MQLRADGSALRAPLPSWAVAAFLHVACTIALTTLAARAPGLMPGASWYWFEGGGAALLGAIAGLPVWWLPINLLFVPTAHALLGWQLPAPCYLAVCCALYAVNVSAWRHRVPLFLSSARAVAALAAWLPRHAGFRFIDLGCGTGSLLVDLAKARPDGEYHGIEAAPLPFLLSRWRARTQPGMSVMHGNFWDTGLAGYDVVYAYLSPAPMARLWRKARREMRAGSLLVSNSFAVPGVAPTYTLPVGDGIGSVLFIWRM
ncbi:MAG: class I SAM-dependent methyltransferase [Betaproteobacteria bacterium]|nr:class I SAM-dependent methyltransferase [Betaproteobacteria bacterium]